MWKLRPLATAAASALLAASMFMPCRPRRIRPALRRPTESTTTPRPTNGTSPASSRVGGRGRTSPGGASSSKSSLQVRSGGSLRGSRLRARTIGETGPRVLPASRLRPTTSRSTPNMGSTASRPMRRAWTAASRTLPVSEAPQVLGHPSERSA